MFKYGKTLLILIIIINSFKQTDSWNAYCNSVCGSAHILCIREPCGKGAACGKIFKMMMLDNDEREYIRYLHNKLRNDVAVGGGRLFSSNAANMCAISYSLELEFIAQCAANACYVETYEYACRHTFQHSNVAQNSFVIKKNESINFGKEELLGSAVQHWYSQKQFLEVSMIDEVYRVHGSPVESFINLIWADTINIGCGRSFSSGGGWIIICYYTPSRQKGEGQPVFKRGEPCKACETCESGQKCNTDYMGLCGQIRRLEDDPFVEPFDFPADSTSAKWANFIVVLSSLILTLK